MRTDFKVVSVQVDRTLKVSASKPEVYTMAQIMTMINTWITTGLYLSHRIVPITDTILMYEILTKKDAK